MRISDRLRMYNTVIIEWLAKEIIIIQYYEILTDISVNNLMDLRK